MTDATIRSRADELIAGMTTAEKAGQLSHHPEEINRLQRLAIEGNGQYG